MRSPSNVEGLVENTIYNIMTNTSLRTLERILKVKGRKAVENKLKSILNRIYTEAEKDERIARLIYRGFSTPDGALSGIVAYVSSQHPGVLAFYPEIATLLRSKKVEHLLKRLSALTGISLPVLRTVVAAILGPVKTYMETSAKELRAAIAAAPPLPSGGKGFRPGQRLSEFIQMVRNALNMVDIVKRAIARYQYIPPEIMKIAKLVSSISNYIIRSGESTQPFGVITGIRQIRSLEEVRDLTPTERGLIAFGRMLGNTPMGAAVRAYSAYRLVTKQSQVYNKTIRVKPHIFIDFSGSMSGGIPGSNINNYGLAVAIAIGIINSLGFADIYLFNDYPYNLSAALSYDKDKIVKALIGLWPHGGTSIENVLETIIAIEEAAKKKPSERPFYIIITDAEDNVNKKIIDNIKRLGMMPRIALLVLSAKPPYWAKEFKNAIIIRSYEDIANAIKKIAEAMVATVTRVT